MTARILVADDERDLLATVGYALRRDGLEVETVEDGEAALAAARTGAYDVLVLDVMMPKLSGIDVCRIVRGESDLPILMLTAKDAELDRVLGLELGADDYVTKPFSIAELTSRIRALLRRRELDRTAPGGDRRRASAAIRIDFARHRVEVDGRPTRLTPSEFKLLALLAEEPDRVLTRTPDHGAPLGDELCGRSSRVRRAHLESASQDRA